MFNIPNRLQVIFAIMCASINIHAKGREMIKTAVIAVISRILFMAFVV